MAFDDTISWSAGDPFDVSKLNGMVSNEIDLDDRMIELSYRYQNEAVRTQGASQRMVMISGVEDIGFITTADLHDIVQFPDGTFNDACFPVVIATVEKKITKPISLVVHNVNNLNHIGSSGFKYHIVHDNFLSPINSYIKLHWMAIGWQTEA